MSDKDELAELEAERDRSRSIIAYHERPTFTFWLSFAPWARSILIGLTFGVGAMIVAGVLAGQIEISSIILIIFLILFLLVAAYIFTRKISVSVISMLVNVLFAGPWPPWRE
jgi:hypothetical protein